MEGEGAEAGSLSFGSERESEYEPLAERTLPTRGLFIATSYRSAVECAAPRERRRNERPGPRVSNHARDGAVAQLGERLNGIQEVVGSIPISSTTSNLHAGSAGDPGASSFPGGNRTLTRTIRQILATVTWSDAHRTRLASLFAPAEVAFAIESRPSAGRTTESSESTGRFAVIVSAAGRGNPEGPGGV